MSSTGIQRGRHIGAQRVDEGAKMLGGEHLGGGEQSRLAAGSRHRHHRGGGHHSFSRPHFTLNQAIHGVTTGHVVMNLLHNSELVFGQREGQTLQKGVGLLARNTWRAGTDWARRRLRTRAV